MKITAVDVMVCSPGRNFVTLKITTEDGLTGLGDATLNGRELAVASYLRDHLAPLLLGRDARRIEDTWQYLYRGAYWRRGPVTMTAIGAVDLALWDIKAKAANQPLYQLLGGACRDGVTVYRHAYGETIDDVAAAASKLLAQGYRAVRVQSAIPGLANTYGVSAKGARYEPAQAARAGAEGVGLRPPEESWATEPYLDWAPRLFAGLREALGPGPQLLHDAHHRLTPIEAARLGKSLEPYRLFWLEDPVPAEWQEGYRHLRRHTTTPIAVGEVFNSVHDCHVLIEENLIDYLRMPPSHGGGITALRKIAALGEVHHVKTACHGPSDLSPVAIAAAVHFGLSVSNFGMQEWMGHPPETDAVFHASYRYADGMLHPGEPPGLGVTFDEAAAQGFPYRPAYLPVARKADGSMHDW